MTNDPQQLHKVRGSVEVALDLLERAAAHATRLNADDAVLEGFARATNALAHVVGELDENIVMVRQMVPLGPAA